MENIITTDALDTDGMATELSFFTVAVTVTHDGETTDQYIPVQANSPQEAALEFVAQEVYRNDWKFQRPVEDQLRIARTLASGFLARRLPENWQVSDFEGSTFREVCNNPNEAREFTIGFVTEGVIEE